MFQFNFDSKILALQIPSGLLFGLLTLLLCRFIHLPLIPTNIPFLLAVILLIDLLHFLGNIDIDISNLFQRSKSRRKISKDNLGQSLQAYLEEHLIFLLSLFGSIFLGRLTLFRKWSIPCSFHSSTCNSSIIRRRKNQISLEKATVHESKNKNGVDDSNGSFQMTDECSESFLVLFTFSKKIPGDFLFRFLRRCCSRGRYPLCRCTRIQFIVNSWPNFINHSKSLEIDTINQIMPFPFLE